MLSFFTGNIVSTDIGGVAKAVPTEKTMTPSILTVPLDPFAEHPNACSQQSSSATISTHNGKIYVAYILGLKK